MAPTAGSLGVLVQTEELPVQAMHFEAPVLR